MVHHGFGSKKVGASAAQMGFWIIVLRPCRIGSVMKGWKANNWCLIFAFDLFLIMLGLFLLLKVSEVDDKTVY